MLKKITLLVAAAALVLVLMGCEEDDDFTAMSQAEWTTEGWKAWEAGDYDGAITLFGNALKVDPYYAEAQCGLGWTYLRMQNISVAIETLESAVLVSEQVGTELKVRQSIYMGVATAYQANDDYDVSAERALFMINNLQGQNFTFIGDSRVTGYDVYILLALNYYGMGNANRCVWAVNKMRGMIGESQNYEFTDWRAMTAEIERLIGRDPSV
ncbi:MAG: tetratricopeptide repeat protein [Candidatus Zixiibacteriota bacterium]|jgi:tetratricopeptide (TPR) repeat protein